MLVAPFIHVCVKMKVLIFIGRFTALRFTATGAPPAVARTNFADESVCLLPDNVRNEVVTIHRSQEVLKMLSLYT
jgi:hypothetical protein